MKELYREIKINKHGLRFLPKLSLSGLAEVVYFYLPIYFPHASSVMYTYFVSMLLKTSFA